MRILYIDIDSLRPDHLGCYGYHRRTSPTIDHIAADGVVFERCYTSDAPCMPSRSALYSGRFGIQTGVVGHGGTAAQPKVHGRTRGIRDVIDEHSLPRQLQLAGHHTAMISPFGQRHSARHIYAGFNEVYDTGNGGMESAEDVQPVVVKWVKENAHKPNWFLHINYWDVHTPYRVPIGYGEPFAQDPLPAWLQREGLIAEHNRLPGPHSSMEFAMYDDSEKAKYPRNPGKITDEHSLRRMVDGYDTAIRYVDDQIAQVVELLQKAQVYDDMLIVISADHGENLGELGIYGEHATADGLTCRVPMIVKSPGGRSGARDHGLHYSLDLAPTILDLVGAAKPKWWDGISFAPSLREEVATGREELILTQGVHVCQRSVRWDDWIYIRTYHDGFHLFPGEMLFNLKDDPHEEHDLAAQQPALCREGAWRLMRWHDEQMQHMAARQENVTDPLWTIMAEDGPYHARLNTKGAGQPGRDGFLLYLQRLEKTGRAEQARQLREKYAAQLSA
jgi:choline-sulfatase